MDMTENRKIPERRSSLLPFLLLALLCAAGLMLLIHLSAENASGAAQRPAHDLTESFESASNNAKARALDGLTYIRKIYKIPEQALSAPAPDPEGFGSTGDPAVIQSVIDGAAVLLDGQRTVWNAEIERYRDLPFQYYYDETILVITWKEVIGKFCCTFAEVKLADGSQLRRKLAGDSYDSGVREYCSKMAREANAVLATNGDFYAHRQFGVTVYQRQLYRCETELLDSCFFTSSGEMLLKPKGSFTSREEVERFVSDNDVVFSAAFGPIVVQDGELKAVYGYRIGDTGLNYARTILGRVDELHYLVMTVNHDFRVEETPTINEAGAIIHGKGVTDAYALDGGQTSELWMNGSILNHIEFNSERQVSDIIYFASALPGGKEG